MKHIAQELKKFSKVKVVQEKNLADTKPVQKVGKNAKKQLHSLGEW